MHNILLMSSDPRSAFESLKKNQSSKLAARCGARDADIFWLRLERYFEDLYYPLMDLYGNCDDAIEQFGLLFDQMVDAYAVRPRTIEASGFRETIYPKMVSRTQHGGLRLLY